MVFKGERNYIILLNEDFGRYIRLGNSHPDINLYRYSSWSGDKPFKPIQFNEYVYKNHVLDYKYKQKPQKTNLYYE